jgi:hypothetical protein
MARYAIVEDGVVTNIVEWDGNEEKWSPPDGADLFEASDAVGPGWRLSSGELAPPAQESPPVPQVVSRAQLKLALLAAGILDAVEGFVATADRAVQIMWAERAEFDRHHPLLAEMVTAFGMTPGQADDIFRLAATL